MLKYKNYLVVLAACLLVACEASAKKDPFSENPALGLLVTLGGIGGPTEYGLTPAPAFNVQRFGYAAVKLADGKILITGGTPSVMTVEPLDSAELYDPATNTFTLLTTIMTRTRTAHTMTLLSDGRVLITGGRDALVSGAYTTTRTAEIYTHSGSGGTFAATGMMNVARGDHGAILLSATDNKVLVLGGTGGSAADLYDPAGGTFTAAAGSIPNGGGVYQMSRVELTDGKVLLAGGRASADSAGLSSAYLFTNTGGGTFALTGFMSDRRINAPAVVLNDNRVLLAGGSRDGSQSAHSTTLYEPGSGTFSANASLTFGTGASVAVKMNDGNVLLAGDWPRNQIYDVATGNATEVSYDQDSSDTKYAFRLSDGRVLLLGGRANHFYAP